MRLEDTFVAAVVFVAAIVVVIWLAFALASLFSGFPRLRLHQILGIVGVTAWVFGFINALGPPYFSSGYLLFFTTVGVLLCFAGMWAREFRLLMLRRADEFPGRFDKLSWTFVLTVMAPAGVWMFRSYRRVQWPESAKQAAPHPLDEQAPIGDPSEMNRIGA
jgi:hypothetical protein